LAQARLCFKAINSFTIATSASKREMHAHKELLRDLLTGLYRDRIFPNLSVIRARLHQMSETSDAKTVVPGLKELLDAAQQMPEDFKVEEDTETSSDEEKQVGNGQLVGPSLQRSIQFTRNPSWFEGWIDTSAHADPFPSTLWAAFEKYLENLARLVRNSNSGGGASGNVRQDGDFPQDNAPGIDVPSHAFRGECFSMALELEQRRLPFLQGRKLGEIYHIVHLALQKKLLAYEDNFLVPTAVHSVCRNTINTLAATSRRSTVGGVESMPVVQTHSELRDVVQKVLLECPEGLDLSMLKVKILETQNVRLNESVFGCAKLLELVRLPALSSVCAVERLPGRSAYRLVRRGPSHGPPQESLFTAAPEAAAAAAPVGRRAAHSPPPPPPQPAARFPPWGAPAMPPRKPLLLATAPAVPAWPHRSSYNFAPRQEARDANWQTHDVRENFARQQHPTAEPPKALGVLGTYGTSATGCVDMDLTEGAPWRGNSRAAPAPPHSQSPAPTWGHYPPHWPEAPPGLAAPSATDALDLELRSMGLMEACGFHADDGDVTEPQLQQSVMPGQTLLGTEPAIAKRSEEQLPTLLGSGRILAGILAGSGTGPGTEDRSKTEEKWIDDMTPKVSPKNTTKPLIVSSSLLTMEGEPAYIPLREVCF